MNNKIFFLMGGLLCATFAAVNLNAGTAAPDALVRKAGGASERLLRKQQERRKGASQNQPEPEQQLARKVGGAKTRLLSRDRKRGMTA